VKQLSSICTEQNLFCLYLFPAYKIERRGCLHYRLIKSLSFRAFSFMNLECLVHVLSNLPSGHWFFWRSSLLSWLILLKMPRVPTPSISFRQSKINLYSGVTFLLTPVSLWIRLVTILVGWEQDLAKQKSQVKGRIKDSWKYCKYSVALRFQSCEEFMSMDIVL